MSDLPWCVADHAEMGRGGQGGQRAAEVSLDHSRGHLNTSTSLGNVLHKATCLCAGADLCILTSLHSQAHTIEEEGHLFRLMALQIVCVFEKKVVVC